MSRLRKPVIMGLVLLLCTLTGHFGKCAPTITSMVARDDGILRRIVDFVKHVGENVDQNINAKTVTASRKESTVEPRDLRSLKSDRGDQIIEIFPRDLRKKEKFIQHLTGPLYFSPKCRKQVYRLYHNTRECTIPAYFKRCARLLTRLAGRSQCIEG